MRRAESRMSEAWSRPGKIEKASRGFVLARSENLQPNKCEWAKHVVF